MHAVKVTELRSHLPSYLEKVQKGEEIWVTSRGHVIARLLPPLDPRLAAREQLKVLRGQCKVGDVVSPLDEPWDVEHGDS